MKWLDKIIALFSKRPPAMGDLPQKGMPLQVVASFAGSLAGTQPGEIACDEVDSLMDGFAEIMARGEDASRIMPLVRLHIDHCPECREELEALLAVIEAYQQDDHHAAKVG
ncbi:MAG: hypothetical protein HPY76_12860 [Anaerolineae bacterium]|nr:hypothetical protein [Anaerolineae bacterium]